MKLALINDDTGEIIKVYGRNTTVEITDKFMETAGRLIKADKNKTVIERNQQLRWDANFEEIGKMGFVHRSEIEAIFEKKLIEVQNRITLKLRLEYYIERPLKKAGFRIATKLGLYFIKNFTNGRS